jgi:hypothetical protein
MRERLLEELQQAKRRVARCQTLIAKQKASIARLNSLGADKSEADEALARLETTQDIHFAEVERILDELDKLPLVE